MSVGPLQQDIVQQMINYNFAKTKHSNYYFDQTELWCKSILLGHDLYCDRLVWLNYAQIQKK